MRLRLRLCSAALAAALALALLYAGGARAQLPTEQRVVAGPIPISYLTTSVSINQGDALRFLNADLTAVHDVASVDRAADGSFLFKSKVVPAPTDVPVVGAERLRAGSYGFFCTIHPSMRGTLEVGGGEVGGGDTTPPELAVKILDDRIRKVLRRGKLRTRVTVDEPASVRLNATVGRGEKRKRIAKRRAEVEEAGSKRIAAKLTRAGKRLLRRSDRVRVTLKARAVDEAGNAGRDRAAKTLR